MHFIKNKNSNQETIALFMDSCKAFDVSQYEIRYDKYTTNNGCW